jgi:hypothetical protein
MLCYTKNSKRSTIFKGVPYCHPRTGGWGKGIYLFSSLKVIGSPVKLLKAGWQKEKGV